MSVEQFDEQGRPVRVKVGPVDIRVIWVDNDESRSMKTSANHDPIYQTIRIMTDLPATGKAVDFVHEVMHACRYQSVNPESGDMSEEAACQLAAVHLTAFWRDNQQTFAWWSGLLNA